MLHQALTGVLTLEQFILESSYRVVESSSLVSVHLEKCLAIPTFFLVVYFYDLLPSLY